MMTRASLFRVSVLALLMGAAGMGAPACGSQDSLLSAKEASTSGGGYGTAVAASGTGGSVIHEGDGGAGGATTPSKLTCGKGCTPATGEATPCALGGGGAGGAGGSGEGTCQLSVEGDEVLGVCGLAGSAADGAPCLSASDCAAGYGCVEPGVCRAYCCGDSEACPGGSFCEAALLKSAGLSEAAPSIPVCSPTEPCTLLDDTSCATPGEACTIVRSDGTTSCVVPGAGKAGDACPCAAGHVCSFAESRCLKLCRTNRSEDCPVGHQCSGGSKPYPAGFGVCVEL